MSMSKEDFLTRSSVQVETLEYWIEQRWIIPEQSPAGVHFSDRDVARARLVQDLSRDFGINDEGIDVILHLMDQLHGLRRALAHLQTDIQGKPR